MVRELAADGVPVATACRVLQVSTSGFYDWLGREPSTRERADAALTETIAAVHAASYGTCGARRVHAELRLGQHIRVGRKRVERLMRCHRLQGVHRRRLRGCTRRDAAAEPAEDLVQRRFTAAEPDRLYVADITQHRTGQGWVYLAVVLEVFSRRVVGWAIADHLRAELVVDALQTALWQRRPATGAIHHSDHGAQYTSWAFGQRLREAGLLGSMGTIGDCFDNAAAESLNGLYKTELIRRRGPWRGLDDVELATLEYVDWFNHRRLHSHCGDIPPVEFENDYYRQIAGLAEDQPAEPSLTQPPLNPGRFTPNTQTARLLAQDHHPGLGLRVVALPRL